MNFAGRLLLILALLPAIVAAAPKDRREMVTGTYKLLAPMARLLLQQSEFKNMSGDQQRVYRTVLNKIETLNIPLVFEKDGFVLTPGEPPRLMKTPIGDAGKIHINEPLLNSSEDIDPALLLKLFMHEHGHKAPEIPLAERDHVFRALEKFARKFQRRSEIEGGLVVHTLSIPADLIDDSVGGKTPGPQPVNLLLIERDGAIHDATSALIAAATDAEEQTQSVWTEAREGTLSISQAFKEQVRAKLGPAVEEFNRRVREMGLKGEGNADEMMKAMGFSLHELRVLELLTAEGTKTGDDFFVRLKASYMITRSQRATVHFDFKGFNIGEPEAVPITIALRIPKSGAVKKENFGIHLRPKVSEEADIPVAGVVRGASGTVDVLKIDWKSDKAPPKDLRLSVMYDLGLRLVPAVRTDLVKPGQWKIEFQMPWAQMTPDRPAVAESLVVDGDRALDLDRLVVLTAGGLIKPAAPKPNRLMTVGLWTIDNGKPAFKEAFDPLNPLFTFDHMGGDSPTFPASKLYVEVELEKPQAVVEVRLHYRMLTAILRTEEGQRVPPEMLTWWDGQNAKFAVEGHVKYMKNHMQVLSNWGEGSKSYLTPRGTMRTQARFEVPLKFAGELTAPEEAHLIPMIQPMFVEAVLEDGQVLRRTLDTGAACDRDLTGG